MNRNCAEAYDIKGQIQIEEFKYDLAVDSFKRANFLNGKERMILFRLAQAKYLQVKYSSKSKKNHSSEEFSYKNDSSGKTSREKTYPDDRSLQAIPDSTLKKLKAKNLNVCSFFLNSKNKNSLAEKGGEEEKILSIIRDLDRIQKISKKDEDQERVRKEYLKKAKKSIRNTKYYYLTREDPEKKLEEILTDIKKCIQITKKIIDYRYVEPCTLCFLGYFYYQVNDYFTAKIKLKKCIHECENHEKMCKDCLEVYDEYLNLKVTIRQNKPKIDFPILEKKEEEDLKLIKVFAKEFSEQKGQAGEIFNNVLFKTSRVSLYEWWLQPPLERGKKQSGAIVLALLIIMCLVFHPIYKNTFGDSVNWVLYTLFVALLILILLYPFLEEIKVQEIEVKLHSPKVPDISLSPTQFRDKIKKLETLKNS